MPLEFAPECCDAHGYIAMGEACAEHVKDCWHALRPTGAVLYFSVPFRLGLPAEWIIVLNAIFVLGSVVLGFLAMKELSAGTTRVSRIALAVCVLAAHAAFMGATIRNSLTDGPSSAVAMMSMWTLVFAMKRDSRVLYATAGAALGVAAIIRAFYLYPALPTAACVLFLSIFRKRSRVPAVLFCAALAAPILLQFTLTHANVDSWSFIDPASLKYGQRLHFETALYGWDTVLPWRGFPYAATECFPTSFSMGDAIRKHHWSEVACLVGRREWFYFGSYVWGGGTYLASADDRHFSVLLLVAQGVAALSGTAWAFARRERARLLFVPFVLLGASLGEGSFIIPESRFLMAVHVTLWMLAFTALHDVVIRFLHREAESSVAESGFGWIPVAFSDSVLMPIRSWWASPGPRSLVAPAIVLPATAVLLVFVVHGMALGSGLQDEDLRHVFESVQLDTFKFLVRPYGNHFCAFFRLSVAVLHSFFGVNPAGYFAVMVLTHLLHVALLYGIIRALTASRFVACVFAALWGAFPGFQGTLQWFAAYSHMLGTTAVLLSLWELSRAREALRPPSPWSLVRISIAMFLGAATELTGSLTAVFFPLMAFAFLPRPSAPLRTALLLLPSALLSAFVVVHFTESGNSMVAAFFELRSVLTMFVELCVYGVGLLALGPFVSLGADETTWIFGASNGEATAVSALIFLPLLGVVLVRIVRGDWDERRVLLAMIGFAGFIYAAIAAGRSGLTFGRPLSWMATRDRYHYQASVGLVVALAVAVSRTWPSLAALSGRRAFGFAAAASAVWAVAGHVAAKRTYLRGGGRQEWTRDWAELADASLQLMARRLPPGKVLYVRNDLFRPAGLIYAMGASQAVLPGIGAYWIAAHGVRRVDERKVRFVEMDKALLKRIRARSRPAVSAMFVSPGQVLRAEGEIRTLEADAPPAVVRYLLESPDPAFAPNDHALADRLRQVVRAAAVLPPLPLGPPPIEAVPDPEEPPPPPPTQRELEEKAVREAIAKDPKAQEELRRAFAEDPKAREELRKALIKQRQDSDD